ncbi:MAG: hypothetical protein ACP5NY_06490 [Thermocladium sp.]
MEGKEQEITAMILLTTSRDPSQRTRQFINELIKCIPGSAKLNRGKTPLRVIIRESPALIQVVERNGNPGEMRLYRNGRLELRMIIQGIKLLRDMHSINRRRAATLSAVGRGWAAEVISQALGIQLYPTSDPGELRGSSDAIALIAEVGGSWRLEFLDGVDLGPCGPSIIMSNVELVIK